MNINSNNKNFTAIVLIDRSPILREAMRTLLYRINPNNIIIEVEDIDSAEQKIQKFLPACLVIYNLTQITQSIIFKLHTLKTSYSNVNLLVCSGLPKTMITSFCTSVGAENYITHTTSLEAIYAILNSILNMSDQDFKLPKNHTLLSDRQIQILKLIEQGLSNQEIANNLQLKIGSVKTHITRVFYSLRVTNRSQAVYTAKKLNYFS